MYETLLWATDGSPEADRALTEGLRNLSPGGRVVAFHCDQRFPGSRVGGAPILADEDDRRTHVQSEVARLRAQGVDAKLHVSVTSAGPASAIAAAAASCGADAIVCATQARRGVRSRCIPSTAARVIRRVHVPVIIVPSSSRPHERVAAS